MFSVIPANRPCLTNFITISPTQFAFSFPSSPHFSHLVVFILPGNTLPPDTAAGVHIRLPGSTEFRFLGAIANEKPSAIFRVNLPGSKQQQQQQQQPQLHGSVDGLDGMTDPTITDLVASAAQPTTQPELDMDDINLGISVEPASNIQAQLATLQAQTQSSQPPNSPSSASAAMVVHRAPPPTKLLAQRIIKNAFNFLASFAGGAGGQEVVPLKSFQDWWTKFERRVENDPGFLERDEGL
jgi:protein Hikeshi